VSPVLIVAALRWTDARTAVDPLTGDVRGGAPGAGPGPADRCALEHALRIAEATGGRCVAVSVAPEAAVDMLREALACGADEVLRVDSGGAEDDRLPDSGAATARLLATALREKYGTPDLIVTGDRSPDRGTGHTPAFLAAEFGSAQALGLIELSLVDNQLTGLRRLDRGRRERLVIPFPAVCSVEPAGVRLRRASLPATVKARTATVPVATPAAGYDERVIVHGAHPYRPRPKELPPPQGMEARQRVLQLTGTNEKREPPRVVVTDDPAEAADELLEFLRGKGYLE
jgi:electron transfer flavoprotein beta subunit